MNSLTRIMSYDKTKIKNQESCNCEECFSKTKDDISVKIKNIIFADDFLTKVENYRLIYREYEILNTMNLAYWYKDVKTKNFIWKSLHVHGDKYIYHKSVYVKSKEKVLIECRIKGHEPFPQTPIDHKQGHGCPKCGIKVAHDKTKMTMEEFIEEANEVHGKRRYDYSEVNYKGVDVEVCIICHEHDVPFKFMQTPKSHLDGHGCRICGYKLTSELRAMTLEEFIEKANKVHGIGRYDYSKVKYVNNHTEVIIICHNHKIPHEFPQTPHSHLRKRGCDLCRESQGAKKVRLFLVNNNIEFEREKRFDDCRYKKSLPFDFYIPKYNLCIEFDGEQHFRESAFKFNKISKEKIKENFKLIQLRDQIKNNYCEQKGINLLRIKYNENVEKKLIDYFQEHRIIKEESLFELVS